MTWIKVISFIVLASVLLISCEKRFNNPVAKKYVIEGQLFEDYEFEAVQDFPLELVYYEVNSRNEWVAQETVDRYVTEGDGYFKFKYSKFSSKKEGFLAIQQDASKRENNQAVVSKPMLQGINLNQDLERSIAITPISRTRLIIQSNSNNFGDTLFFSSPNRRVYLNVDLTNYTRFGVAGKVIEDSRSFCEISHNWKGNLGQSVEGIEPTSAIIWGRTMEDYKKAFYWTRFDSIPDYYNDLRFRQSGFPFIDTVHIELD